MGFKELIEKAREGILFHGVSNPLGRKGLEEMMSYRTPIYGIVEPGKGGTEYMGIKVYDTVHQAFGETGKKVLVTSALGEALGDLMLEAMEAKIELIVALGDDRNHPSVLKALRILSEGETILLGPSSYGFLSPSQGLKIGALPHKGIQPGSWILISRSAPLAYHFLQRHSIGISLWVDIGEEAKGRGNFKIVEELLEGGKEVLYVGVGDLFDLEIFRRLKRSPSKRKRFVWIPQAASISRIFPELSAYLEALGFERGLP